MAGSQVFLAEVKPVTLLIIKSDTLGEEEDLLRPKHFKQALLQNNKRFTGLYESPSSRTMKTRRGLPTGQPEVIRFPF